MSKHCFNLDAMQKQKAYVLFPVVKPICPTPARLQDAKP